MDDILWVVLLSIVSFAVLFIVLAVVDHRKNKNTPDDNDEFFGYFGDDLE